MLQVIDAKPGVKEVRYERYAGHAKQYVKLGTFERDVDGFYYFWPIEAEGCWSDGDLIAIGTALKNLNKPWDEQIEELCSNPYQRALRWVRKQFGGKR